MERKLKDSEIRLLDIIWENEPLSSRELTVKAQEALGWKRTTTYTVLKWLVNNGVCENVNATVRSLVKRDEVQKDDSRYIADYVKSRFNGSLPKFITSFARSEELSKEEAKEIIEELTKYIN